MCFTFAHLKESSSSSFTFDSFYKIQQKNRNRNPTRLNHLHKKIKPNLIIVRIEIIPLEWIENCSTSSTSSSSRNN